MLRASNSLHYGEGHKVFSAVTGASPLQKQNALLFDFEHAKGRSSACEKKPILHGYFNALIGYTHKIFSSDTEATPNRLILFSKFLLTLSSTRFLTVH